MRVYAKALVACIPALLAIAKVISDAAGVGHVTSAGWLSIAVTALGAIGVYAVPNTALASAAVPVPAPVDPVKPAPVDTATIVIVQQEPPAPKV